MARFGIGVQELFSEISEKTLDKKIVEEYNGRIRPVRDTMHGFALWRGRIVA
jgi:hypothetical protein